MFKKQFESFLQNQIKVARGQRREMLQRGLKGTKLLVENVLLPVLGSLKDIELEYEMISVSGTLIYCDAFNSKLRTVFEEDDFVTHAEKVTRDRFSFERARARSVGILGYTYFPYSRDELEKRPEFCRRNLFELIGRIGTDEGFSLNQLPVYEREILRFALLRGKPFQIPDACLWLQLKYEACRNVLRSLEKKEFIHAINGGEKRCHAFMISQKGIALMHTQRH